MENAAAKAGIFAAAIQPENNSRRGVCDELLELAGALKRLEFIIAAHVKRSDKNLR